MAIVYQHRKPGEQLPFYIGWGTKENRAHSKTGRNKFWHNVVNKYGYDVDILINDCTESEAKQIEKYLIRYYGRKDLGLGLLVNLTDGGEGDTGRIASIETRKKISNAKLGELNPMFGKGFLQLGDKNPVFGRKFSVEVNKLKGLKGDKNPAAKTIIISYINNKFKSFTTRNEAADYLQILPSHLSSIIGGTRKMYKRLIEQGIQSIYYK